MKNIVSNYYEAINIDSSLKFDCTNGSAVCVLPRAKDNTGKFITVKKTDSTANTVTVINKDTDVMYDCTLQVETATVVGAITGSGNATVVFTAANVPSSPITISVPVDNGDAIATTAKKIVGVMSTYKDITDKFTIVNSGASIVITSKKAYPNDTTLNLSIDNGTCTGLTTAATSTGTTAGVGVTIATQNAWKTFESNGEGWVKVDEGGVNETQTLANVTLTAPNFTGLMTGEKVRLTPEGGIAVKMTNKTGGASVKGEVVGAYSATSVDNAVKKIAVDVPDPIGVFYESGVADGSEAWVVVSGIAEVYFIGNAARGNIARGFITGDAGYVAGQALAEAVPSSPFATDKHFYEIGHVIQSRTGAGLAKCVLHFN